jgi:hypothetical protein
MSLPHRIFLIVASVFAILLCFLIVKGPRTRPSELAPSLPPISELFITDTSFIGWDHSTSQKWMEQLSLPHNLSLAGLVITTNLRDGTHTWSDISMFHQLRCLIYIRQELLSLSESLSYTQAFMKNHSDGSNYDITGRCFDYIRQVKTMTGWSPRPISMVIDSFVRLI